MTQRRITITSGGVQRSFTGDWELHAIAATGTYFLSVPDSSVPSGRSVAWQQQVENGIAEAVKIVMEGVDPQTYLAEDN